MKNERVWNRALWILPWLIVLWIWASALSFVPVPWPDDSAFYFVGRELFKWPPRWVMLPQAPFEPTYRIFNFNTMPLYPILIGLGRWVGIDGIHAIKLWPLSAFAASGAVLGAWLFRAGLPPWGALLVALGFMLDPGMRWGAVIVRPESLIGLAGVLLVLGLALDFPERFRARGFWNPVAALLALGAYCHFNAVHLLFIVVLAFVDRPREVMRIGMFTALYLAPWFVTVLWHPGLFMWQMQLQWTRLQVSNDWLSSVGNAVHGLYQDMGSPESWSDAVMLPAVLMWALIFSALVWGLILPLTKILRAQPRDDSRTPRLIPAAGWILGSCWLWENKPEVWFTYYIHAAVWTFAGLAFLAAWKRWKSPVPKNPPAPYAGWVARILIAVLGVSTVVFAYADVDQAARLDGARSWHWPVYHDYVDCIDQELIKTETRLGHPTPFRVWGPTFPDVTIELSRRHPDWEFTRTNDFYNRNSLAVAHGNEVEAVVTTEMISPENREISGPLSEHPEVHSLWMTWKTHYLNRLWIEPGWKPTRYFCQRGRWQAFIFEK